MTIKSAEYIMSEVDISRYPDDSLFEIVLIGKSNVGKSSFINSFCGRKNLARISSQPGKTRTANFYKINGSFYFADMPGYGYAKVSKTMKSGFDKIIKEYLTKRKTDFAVFFLLDSRNPPSSNDLEMLDFLYECDIYPVIVLTKTDKLKSSERQKKLRGLYEVLDRDESDGVMLYSTEKKELIEQMREFTLNLSLVHE